jgi:DNA-binding NtrC family response regulator
MTPLSILIVDDEPPICELLKQTLEKRGHKAACAANGREASDALAADKFDLVITDLLMPDRDGLELISEMRRAHPAIRIIAMTGGGHIPQKHYLFVAKNLGAHGLLEKPFDQKQLLDAIAAAFPSES